MDLPKQQQPLSQQQTCQVPQIQQMAENGFPSAAMEFLAAQMPNQKQYMRRLNKPLVEKKRRARINNSLQQLKTLVVDALNKTNSPKAKLEKADILEMTVRYVRNLQRQQYAVSTAADPDVINKYRAGFNSCVKEVCNFMMAMEKVDPDVKARLLDHLATTIQTGVPSSPRATRTKSSPLKGVEERNVTRDETKGPLQTIQLKAQQPSVHRQQPRVTEQQIKETFQDTMMSPAVQSLTMEAEQQQQQLLQAGYQVENVSDTEADETDNAEPNWKEIFQATFGHESLKMIAEMASNNSQKQSAAKPSSQSVNVASQVQTLASSMPRSHIIANNDENLKLSVAKTLTQLPLSLNAAKIHQPRQTIAANAKKQRVLGSTACQIISIPPPENNVYCDPNEDASIDNTQQSNVKMQIFSTSASHVANNAANAAILSNITSLPCINTFASKNKITALPLSRRPAASTITLSQMQKAPIMSTLTNAAMNAYNAAQPVKSAPKFNLTPKMALKQSNIMNNSMNFQKNVPKTKGTLDSFKYKYLPARNASIEPGTTAGVLPKSENSESRLPTVGSTWNNFLQFQHFQSQVLEDDDDESVWRPW